MDSSALPPPPRRPPPPPHSTSSNISSEGLLERFIQAKNVELQQVKATVNREIDSAFERIFAFCLAEFPINAAPCSTTNEHQQQNVENFQEDEYIDAESILNDSNSSPQKLNENQTIPANFSSHQNIKSERASADLSYTLIKHERDSLDSLFDEFIPNNDSNGNENINANVATNGELTILEEIDELDELSENVPVVEKKRKQPPSDNLDIEEGEINSQLSDDSALLASSDNRGSEANLNYNILHQPMDNKITTKSPIKQKAKKEVKTHKKQKTSKNVETADKKPSLVSFSPKEKIKKNKETTPKKKKKMDFSPNQSKVSANKFSQQIVSPIVSPLRNKTDSKKTLLPFPSPPLLSLAFHPPPSLIPPQPIVQFVPTIPPNLTSDPADDKVKKFRTISISCLFNQCTLSFSTTFELNRHLLVDHGVKMNRCPYRECSATFHHRYELDDHIKQVHPTVRVWDCYACTSKFHGPHQLNNHLFLTHFDGHFVCGHPGCGFSGRVRTSVIEHFNRFHCGAMPLQLPIPPMTRSLSDISAPTMSTGLFVSPSAAAETLPKKDVEKAKEEVIEEEGSDVSFEGLKKVKFYLTQNVKCILDGCEQFFNSKAEMNHHLKSHNMAPIVCPFIKCRQSFKARNHLERHFRFDHHPLNQGSENHLQCIKCAHTLPDATCLYSHVYAFHHEGIFQCKKCDFMAKCRGDIAGHYREKCGKGGKQAGKRSSLSNDLPDDLD